MTQKQYEFVAIGDTVTDAFIRIVDATVRYPEGSERSEICFRFADKVPYEDVVIVPAVGNSANAAVAAARLGLGAALVSNVGDDYFGKECLDALASEKVGTEFISIHRSAKTNYHYVLWYKDDRTILIKHEAYPYALPNFGSPRWLYLSSLGGNSAEFHASVINYLEAHPDIRLAFQPGTFQMKMGLEGLQKVYTRSEVFICNKEEYQRILKKPDISDVKALMSCMHETGPKITVLTDGPKGAYASDGTDMYFMPPYPDPKPPFERTGAGDAFSSTFVVALALGMSMEDALRWAPINSMSVVQYVGAREGLLTREKLEEYLTRAPEGYEPKKI
ncbi:MAG: Sugar kinase, ribokinase family [Parcubacteria group bacterium Gr01-1014_70]|nr:MAG: Sugar kinase, ribokinase family [Parcubacteria group bacterium Gr01-1014_70]